MKPDQATFSRHIGEAVFQSAVDEGRWGIYNEDPALTTWPLIIIWVRAAEKAGNPEKYYFRFELSNYPSMAPTACPWNIATDSRLENNLWPRGNKLVSPTFNYGWNPDALYAPCDRFAMPGHEGWQTVHPELWWQPTFKITVYLNFLHDLLNSSDYVKS